MAELLQIASGPLAERVNRPISIRLKLASKRRLFPDTIDTILEIRLIRQGANGALRD